MDSNRKRIVTSLLIASFLTLGAAFAAAQGTKVKVKGMITTRGGDTLILRTSEGSRTVVLDDNTKVQDVVGLGLRKKSYSAAVLIPGLKVTVDGVSGDQNRITAEKITFDGDDLETAEMIQAGMHPTVEQVAANKQAAEARSAANKQAIEANKQNIEANKGAIEKNIKDIEETNERFEKLTDYDVKGQTTVRFAVSSSRISAKDKQELLKLAQDAVKLKGYLIEVKGFADSTGNAVMNQKLSEDRAQAVVAYLIQDCNVPVRHIVAPGAMGIAHPAASNETKTGRAENRRVEVKVLVNRGLAGGD